MIKIIIPTQKTEEDYKKTSAYKCLEKILFVNNLLCTEQEDYDVSIDIEIIENNTLGLSKLYNLALSKLYNSNLDDHKDDIMVFMHDDLEIHDLWFVEKLLKAHETYDIVGLAGASSQDYTTNKPTAWHLCAKNNDLHGIVNHAIPQGFNNSPTSHINSVYFGSTPHEVAVIDGLFISVKPKTLIEKNVKFDEDFQFHHYDISFCVNAKKAGLKIGVYPIFVIHHGLGEMNNPEWQESHLKFKQKYNNYKI